MHQLFHFAQSQRGIMRRSLAGEHVRQEAPMDAMDANRSEVASKASMASMREES